MARYANIDYARAVKIGFGLGVGLFAVGLLGQLAGSAVLGPLPEFWRTVLVDAELLGVAVALFVPVVFGIVLPLTE